MPVCDSLRSADWIRSSKLQVFEYHSMFKIFGNNKTRKQQLYSAVTYFESCGLCFVTFVPKLVNAVYSPLYFLSIRIFYP